MRTPFDKRSREAVLMGFGLATAQPERVVAGGRTMEVARVRITETHGYEPTREAAMAAFAKSWAAGIGRVLIHAQVASIVLDVQK
jgi:hypothetical protein